MSQLVVRSIDYFAEQRSGNNAGALVPILVKIQLLQRRLLEDEDAFTSSWNWVDAFLRIEHGANSPLYRALRQVMMARRALLLLDVPETRMLIVQPTRYSNYTKMGRGMPTFKQCDRIRGSA